MASNSAHKACPFCGSHRLEVRPVWERYRFVACLDCRAADPVAPDEDSAWELWDARKDPKPEQPRLF